MYELTNKNDATQRLNDLILEVVYKVKESQSFNHRLICFIKDAKSNTVEVDTYPLNNNEFSRSLLGKVKVSELKTANLIHINYISIGVTASSIRNELLENFNVIEKLIQG